MSAVTAIALLDLLGSAPPRDDPTFAHVLRGLRERAGLTQAELAGAAGLTSSAVSALERGARTRPYPHTVRSLARALELDDESRAPHGRPLSVGLASVRGSRRPTTPPGGTMTTLADRPRTALLVIDVQNGVVEGAYERDAVVGRIAALVERVRDAAVDVVWVQHSDDGLEPGTEAWQYAPELVRRDDEPLVAKSYGDSFEQTDLEAVLASRGIGHVLVAGAQTDACIRSTLHGALVRGYDVTLVSDAHTTEDLSAYGAPPPAQVVAHTNLYWSYQTAPGRTAGTVLSTEVDLAVPVGG